MYKPTKVLRLAVVDKWVDLLPDPCYHTAGNTIAIECSLLVGSLAPCISSLREHRNIFNTYIIFTKPPPHIKKSSLFQSICRLAVVCDKL